MKLRVKLAGLLIAPKAKVRYCKYETSYFETSTDTIVLGGDCYYDGAGFRRHLHRVHGCPFTYNYSMQTWSLLHEFGHYNMDDYCEEDELIERVACALIDPHEAQKIIEVASKYYNLEREWWATDWAIKYIKSHPIKARIINFLLK